MQTYVNLCKLMHTYAHLCILMQTMHTYANLFQFILFEYFLSLQPHSRKLRRRRTKISRGICVKIHRPESPLLPCLMEFVMKSQCPSLQRYPVSAYWEKAGAKSWSAKQNTFPAPFASRFRLSHPRQCLSMIPGMLFRHLAMWVDWIRLVCSCFIPSVQKICNITGTMTIPLAGRKSMLC